MTPHLNANSTSCSWWPKSDTALVHKMGADSRGVGLCSAALCGAALLFGTSLLSYVPKPVLGGLLLFLGFTFLAE